MSSIILTNTCVRSSYKSANRDPLPISNSFTMRTIITRFLKKRLLRVYSCKGFLANTTKMLPWVSTQKRCMSYSANDTSRATCQPYQRRNRSSSLRTYKPSNEKWKAKTPFKCTTLSEKTTESSKNQDRLRVLQETTIIVERASISSLALTAFIIDR